MNDIQITSLSVGLEIALQLVFIARVLLRPYREPASRIAWIVVISALPFFGMVIYLLFGETNIGRKRRTRQNEIDAELQAIADFPYTGTSDTPERYRHLFNTGKSVNGFDPVEGNNGRLMADSNAAISSMIADMADAEDHIHLEFYIWLTDNNGLKVVDALIQAAGRGVTVRAAADSLGSRALIRSKYWKEMRRAGVLLVETLPIRHPLIQALYRRLDLRNHRKILIVDNRITYCGSQNCADPEFRVKPRYAPWVDAMIRFEGPVVQQNQFLFVDDWMSETSEDLHHLLNDSPSGIDNGFPAQVIGTGPTVRNSAMPEVFEALMYSARHELIISTPYYVPDEAMQTALCASARRGVETTIIFPARIDSRVTAAACHSHYPGLLDAGVRIYEYTEGLLHTKSMTVDGEMTLIGSANMDRRSFELNFENNILFWDKSLTADLRQRQHDYISRSEPVLPEVVKGWPWYLRLWNNALAMLGPVL